MGTLFIFLVNFALIGCISETVVQSSYFDTVSGNKYTLTDVVSNDSLTVVVEHCGEAIPDHDCYPATITSFPVPQMGNGLIPIVIGGAAAVGSAYLLQGIELKGTQ